MLIDEESITQSIAFKGLLYACGYAKPYQFLVRRISDNPICVGRLDLLIALLILLAPFAWALSILASVYGTMNPHSKNKIEASVLRTRCN